MKPLDNTNTAANNGSETKDKNVKFVSLIPQSNPNEYWQYIDDGFTKAALDFEKHNVTIEKCYFNQFDASSFLPVTEYILSLNPDAVIMAPVFREPTLSFIAKLNERGIPFSFVDSKLSETNYLTYFGQNSFQSGYIAAKILLSLKENTYDVLVMTISRKGDESNQSMSRYSGFLQYMSDNNLAEHISLVTIELKDDDDAYNAQLLEDTLRVNPNIRAAITFNSKVQKLVSIVNKDIRIVGYDILPVNVEMLKNGDIFSLIAQQPEKQSFYSASALFRSLVLGQAVEKDNFLPIDVLYVDNVEDYIRFKEIASFYL